MRRTARCFPIAVLALAGLLSSCNPFDYSSIVTKRYAIVYGISRYASGSSMCSYPNLNYPGSDAKKMAALLAGEGYTVIGRWVTQAGDFETTGTTVVTGTSADAPTKANLVADLSSLTSTIGSTDQLVFYFSGHGGPFNDLEYFCAYGTWTSGGSYAANYIDMMVSETEMANYLTTYINTPRRVVILDSCYSGGFISNALEVDTTPADTTATSSALLTPAAIAAAIANYASFTTSSTGISPYKAQTLSAAGSGESSYDDGGHAQGAMTYYLLQTAASGDLNGDGAVTVLEAFALVKAGIDTVWNVSTSTVYYNRQFSPHISGGPVDFVLF